MKKTASIALFVVLAGSLLASCASQQMRDLQAPPSSVVAPSADKATMVFYRPPIFFGDGLQSSVFDVSGDKPKLVGILSSSRKIAYPISPGRHRFMVTSEAADFLDVEANAGKVYYARVYARFGVVLARFSFRPVPATKPGLVDELSDLTWTANSKESLDWATRNMADFVAKKDKYLPRWEMKPNKPVLNPDDGK